VGRLHHHPVSLRGYSGLKHSDELRGQEQGQVSQPADELGFYLGSVAGMNYQGKDFCCTEPPSEALAAFLCRRPGQDGNKAS
jgi:hypothetical protein